MCGASRSRSFASPPAPRPVHRGRAEAAMGFAVRLQAPFALPSTRRATVSLRLAASWHLIRGHRTLTIPVGALDSARAPTTSAVAAEGRNLALGIVVASAQAGTFAARLSATLARAEASSGATRDEEDDPRRLTRGRRYQPMATSMYFGFLCEMKLEYPPTSS